VEPVLAEPLTPEDLAQIREKVRTLDLAQVITEVILGSSQYIGKIRVWHKAAGECAGLDSYIKVFVSNTDFRNLSNDPDVLESDPGVLTYSYPEIGGRAPLT
jgi:hypothetical protein